MEAWQLVLIGWGALSALGVVMEIIWLNRNEDVL